MNDGFPSDHSYKPLCGVFTIKQSPIEGLGLFTTKTVFKGQLIDCEPTHIAFNGFLIRTPLGGFINHSDKPNATLKELAKGVFYLKILNVIKKGQEVTLDYNHEDCQKVLRRETRKTDTFIYLTL